MSALSRILKGSNARLVPVYKYGRLMFVSNKNKKIDHRYASICTLKLNQYEATASQLLNYISPSSLNVDIRRSYADISAVGLQKEVDEYTGTRELNRELELAERLLRNGKFLNKRFLKSIIETFDKSAAVDPSQMLFILRCCSRNASLIGSDERNALAYKVWDIFHNKALKLDISHYNAFLQVLLENEDKFSPFEFLQNLEAKGVTPNRVTYSRLLHRFCQEGDLDGASKILGIMKEENLPLGETVFNSLIIGNSRANDMEGAFATIDLMKQSDLTPSADTYGTLLVMHAEHGDSDAITKLLVKCKEENIDLPAGALMNSVIALGKHGLDKLIEEIIAIFKTQYKGYNQLIIYTICRLMHDGQYDLGHRLFNCLPMMVERCYCWPFYPVLLVNSGMELDKVMNYCEELHTNEWNILAHDIAFEEYLHQGKHETAFKMLEKLYGQGRLEREHYFYPIVRARAKADDIEGVFEVFELMVKLKIKINPYFIANFLMPSLVPINPTYADIRDTFLRFLSYKGSVNVHILYAGVVQYLLRIDNAFAAQFVKRFEFGLQQTAGMRTQLLNAYEKKYTAEPTACILRQMLPLFARTGSEPPAENVDDAFESIREFVVMLIHRLKRNDVLSLHFIPFLQEMVRNGVCITPGVANIIVDHVGPSSMSPEIRSLLDELCDFDLPMKTRRTRIRYSDDRDNRQEIDMDLFDENSTEADYNLRLLRLVRRKSFAEVREFIQKMKAEEKPINTNIQILMAKMYLDNDQLADAEGIVNGLVDEHPGFIMNSTITCNYALALVKEGRVLDAVKALLMLSPEDGVWTDDHQKPNFEIGRYISLVRNILSTVAEMQDINLLQLLQEALLSRNFADETFINHSLIQYYAKMGNIEEAMRVFETQVVEQKSTAGREELLRLCFETQDNDSIQKIMDWNTKVHGEINSVYDIAFSFLAVGQVNKARKLFQTAGLKPLMTRLSSRCELLLRAGNLAELEDLIFASEPIFNVDRHVLYEHLLNGTINQNNPKKALEIWTSMQDESIVPSREFLSKLASFLNFHGMEAPFTVPKSSPRSPPAPSRRNDPQQRSRWSSPSRVNEKPSQTGGRDRAFESWDNVRNTNIRITYPPHLSVINLLKDGKREEASSELTKLVERGDYNSDFIFTVWEMLSGSGDVDGLLMIKDASEKVDKRNVYYAKLDQAYVSSGRTEERLDLALKSIQESRDDDSYSKLGRSTLLAIIQNAPEFIPKMDEILEAESQKGNTRIAKAMFDALMNSDRMEDARTVHDKFLRNEQNIPLTITCRKAVKNKDVTTLKNILDILETAPQGRENVKGAVLSYYVVALVAKGEVKEGLKVIEDSVKTIPLNKFNLTALENLKLAAQNNDLTFPYDLVAVREEKLKMRKNRQLETSSSDSSSSSSDEEDRKQ